MRRSTLLLKPAGDNGARLAQAAFEEGLDAAIGAGDIVGSPGSGCLKWPACGAS